MKKTLLLLYLIFIGIVCWAQREIMGQVVENDSKTPVQGVSITIKNSNIGTTTDANGMFRLSVPSGAATLVISSSGFSSKEINLADGQTSYDISISRNLQSLDEVVVV